MKYFNQEFLDEEPHDSPVDSRLTLKEKKENNFEAFTYGNENGILHKDYSDDDNLNKSKTLENSVIKEMDTLKETHSQF